MVCGGGLILGPIIGLLVGSLSQKLGSIEPIEELQLSSRAWLSIKIVNPSITLNPLIILSQNKGLMFYLILELILGRIAVLISSLIVFLMFFLIWGFVEAAKTELKIRSEPNQGIKALVKNMAILTPISLILWGVIRIKLMPYLQESMTPEQFKNSTGLMAALITLVTFYGTGGDDFIQHVSLRITLYLNHQKPNDSQTRCIPWNYARFLSYAADRKLLQQTGGAYRFIHRSLLEHFAGMEN